MLAARHRLPPRHPESVQQALVRDGIPKGIRGPLRSYQLARDSGRVTAEDILRAAGNARSIDEEPAGSEFSRRSCFPQSPMPKIEFSLGAEPHQFAGHDAEADQVPKPRAR
jgi:DNA-binding IscR family transcriptional regulator